MEVTGESSAARLTEAWLRKVINSVPLGLVTRLHGEDMFVDERYGRRPPYPAYPRTVHPLFGFGSLGSDVR